MFDKDSQKRKKMGLRFFFQKWACAIPFSVRNFHFFGRGKTNFSGGCTTSKLASQWLSWGIYKHASPVFWRKIRLLYWKKGGQIKSFSWRGELVWENRPGRFRFCSSRRLCSAGVMTVVKIRDWSDEDNFNVFIALVLTCCTGLSYSLLPIVMPAWNCLRQVMVHSDCSISWTVPRRITTCTWLRLLYLNL